MGISRYSPDWNVWIGAPFGGNLFDGNAFPKARVLSIRRSLGGRNLDEATFEILNDGNIAPRAPGVWGFGSLDILANAAVSVQVVEGGIIGQYVHLGRVVQQRLSLNENGESIVFVSKTLPTMFGSPLSEYPAVGGMSKYQPATYYTGIARFETPVFNPVVDDVQWNNKRVYAGNSYLVPIQCLRRDNPTEFDQWSLQDIVDFLCKTCNPLQGYVNNPPAYPPELATIFPRDFSMPLYKYLPDLLDEALSPFGFTWMLVYDDAKPQIVVLSRNGGLGPTTAVRLQSPNQNVDDQLSNVADMRLTYDAYESSVNAVTVVGMPREYELTLDLQPGWEDTYDSSPDNELIMNHETWLTELGKSNAYRRWVLNEGFDYAGIRTGMTSFDFGSQVTDDLDPSTPDALPRRRHFFAMLTQDEFHEPSGKIHPGVEVRWKPPDGDWIDLERSEVQVLKDECGIYITSDNVMLQMYASCNNDPTAIQVQITGTIPSSNRVVGAAAILPGVHPLQDVKIEYLDTKGRYFYRKRESDARPATVYSRFQTDATDKEHDTADETTDAYDYAWKLLTAWSRGSVSGSIALFGVDWGAAGLGYHVDSIQPWGFSLNCGIAGEDPAFPLIAAVDYDIQAQTTTLTLESYRPEMLA